MNTFWVDTFLNVRKKLTGTFSDTVTVSPHFFFFPKVFGSLIKPTKFYTCIFNGRKFFPFFLGLGRCKDMAGVLRHKCSTNHRW